MWQKHDQTIAALGAGVQTYGIKKLKISYSLIKLTFTRTRFLAKSLHCGYNEWMIGIRITSNGSVFFINFYLVFKPVLG